MKFYLGVPEPSWLSRAPFPLFVSHRRLQRIKRRFPRAIAPWGLDSGGFTELDKCRGWQTTEADYVKAVRRYRDEIGNLEWAAPMDWMCEPKMLARTGLSVTEHQRRTIDNFQRLRDAAPDLPFVPVLQGWAVTDYLRCIDLYSAAGIDLTAEPLVGVGTVCRRQHTRQIDYLFWTLAQRHLRLHGFGVKTKGLAQYACFLESADSQAWSKAARSGPIRLDGCTHQNCNYCLLWATQWRADRLTELAQGPGQMRFVA